MNNSMFYSQKKCPTCGLDFTLLSQTNSQYSKKSNDLNDALSSFYEACDLIKDILKSGQLESKTLENTLNFLSECYGYENWVENFKNGIILEDENDDEKICDDCGFVDCQCEDELEEGE